MCRLINPQLHISKVWGACWVRKKWLNTNVRPSYWHSYSFRTFRTEQWISFPIPRGLCQGQGRYLLTREKEKGQGLFLPWIRIEKSKSEHYSNSYQYQTLSATQTTEPAARHYQSIQVLLSKEAPVARAHYKNILSTLFTQLRSLLYCNSLSFSLSSIIEPLVLLRITRFWGDLGTGGGGEVAQK